MFFSRQLEYNKILEFTAEHAVSSDAREEIAGLKPSGDVEAVAERLQMTNALTELLLNSRTPDISNVWGIGEIALRAKKGGMLSMSELLSVRTMMRNSRILESWYTAKEEPLATDTLFFRLFSDEGLSRDIGAAILSESEMSDDASAELKEIRRRILRAENSVRDRLDSIIRSAETKKLLQDPIVTIRSGRFVVPVKAESRAAFKGLVHDISQSGSTFFIEPQDVVDANNRIMELKGEEAREIERILFEFSERVSAVAERLSDSYGAFVAIDVLLAKAKYAISVNATNPKLNDRGYINLKKARHPLISKDSVVPIDLELGGEYSLLVITGPNTGGKTVTLKAAGLLTLMAASGILLPVAEGSEISVFDSVLADIGDEQSIEQSLSTFSGHVSNIARILEHAGRRSLVLLDEIGAGTDPAEGAALAMAILERLRSLGCKGIATTHYGELKAYALQTDGVSNASCEFDVNTLKPTFRLTIGIPGSSNALIIAERLGLDSALIEDARGNIDVSNLKFEEVLREMERMRESYTHKERVAEALLLESQETLKKAEKEAQRLADEAQKAYERAVNRSRQMSADVEASAQKLLEELKRLDNRKADERQKVIARAREIARKDSLALLRDIPQKQGLSGEDLPALDDIIPGQEAFISSLGRTGEILSAPDKNGEVQIRAGYIKTRVHRDMLRAVPSAGADTKSKPRTAAKGGDAQETRSGRNEINLIGLTVDEAVMEAERFLDGAQLSRISTVYLIHGKGTGALRSALQQHLKKLKQVKSFRLAGYGEGDSGVTVVELK
ncbi:MAG: endonuclease MutS2 [Oscillospiraceae bacterium]|nr:endonuclease MutS2 [Oscillospiraceae bacterium]